MFAENATGEVEGTDRTFTTAEPPGPPIVTTEAATAIGGLKATLKGMVNPHGLETHYFFNYGTTNTYGQTTAEVPAGAGNANVPASQLVSGLLPGTEYHFQVVAKNSAGGGSEVKGADKTFTTLPKPAGDDRSGHRGHRHRLPLWKAWSTRKAWKRPTTSTTG